MKNSLNANHDNVLVVEDTTTNREVIRAFLNHINVKCESAHDGLSAVKKCSSVDNDYYSLILMDINMPRLNGYDTTIKLRNMGITAPIIAITAYDRNDSRVKNGRKHFDNFLFKPFNSHEFYTSIAPYIKNASPCENYEYPLTEDNFTDNQYSSVDLNVCDVDKAISNMGGNLRLFTKHFNNFKANNADLSLRLTKLCATELYEECAALCHSMKGLVGMLALTDLYNHLTDLEAILNRHFITNSSEVQHKSTIDELIQRIGDDMRLVCKVQF